MKIIFIYSCLFFLSVFGNNYLFSKQVFTDPNENLILNLYILESEIGEGKYLDKDPYVLGFKKYNGEKLPLEKNIKNRMYTLRTSFYIDESIKDIQLSLFISSKAYPFIFYLNGKQIYKKGRYKDAYNSMIFKSSNIFLSKDLLNYGKNKNELAVQIFPKFETNPFSKIILSSDKNNIKRSFRHDLLNFYFIQGAGFTMFIIFLYFLFLFFFTNLNEYKYLYFAIASLSFIFCYFNIIFYNDSVNEVLYEKISKSSFALCIMFLALFIQEYTKIKEKLKKLKYFLYLIISFPNLIIFFLILSQNSKFNIYKIFNIFIITLIPFYMISAFILILGYSISSFSKNKDIIPAFLLLGYFGLFFGAIHDILFFNYINRDPVVWLTPYGYVSIVISTFFVLSFEQSKLFKLSQNYTMELEQTVKKRTMKLEQTKQYLVKTNKRLTKLDTLKNDFIANITHDFRSPLTAIYNIADLAIKFGVDDNKDNFNNYEIIYQAALRLKNSIDRLLELAKMDAQGLVLKIEKTDIFILMDTILDFYTSSTLGSNIKIIRKYSKTNINNFYTDTEKLEEVLHNILSNAVKFVNPDNGVITVEIINLKNIIKIIISDNGIGIPKNSLKNIFNRFQQAHHKGRNSPYGGTGIGLAFAKQLIQYLKGEIWAKSEGPGKGSKFTIALKKGEKIFNKKDSYFEKNEKKIDSEIKTIIKSEIHKRLDKDKVVTYFTDLNNESEYNINKAKILVIDDDKNIREIIIKYLINFGYKNFIESSDGLMGLNAVYDYFPDLIICDFNMPNMKGDKFHDKLLDSPKYKNIPLIFLSAISDIDLIVERRMKGAADYLKKPIEEELLFLTVNHNLKKYFEYLKTFNLATIDELSGLYNKQEIKKQLKNRIFIREYRSLSLIFFDIDNFKNINDAFGHITGDKLIEKIGKIIKDSTRACDISGRYGGDEFIIILPDTDINQANIVAESIRKKIKTNKIKFNNKKNSNTASFGISSLIDNEQFICNKLKIDSLKKVYNLNDPKKINWNKIEKYKLQITDLLLYMADKALYNAKSFTCKDCGFTSLKLKDFNKKKCPKCKNANIISAKDKIVLFSSE